jgi:Flp pilus assembly protein TadG
VGALAVEGAIVYSVLFLLILGIIIGGIGVFRYQQVACLAREGARWASVHGGDWQTDSGKAASTESQVLQQAVLPLAAGMDPAAVSIQVQFVDRAANSVSAWDKVSHPPQSRDSANNLVNNRVRVTVTYQWVPGGLLNGPLYITSTSEMAMWY